MLIIWPIQGDILIGLWTYKFLTAQQAQKLSKNRHLQSIYVELRALKEKDMIGTIVYWGVSKTGTLQKLHYLTPKGAMTVAEFLRIDLERVKYPKSTNTLVKNDFVHRIKTIDLRIAYDEWIANTVFEPLFFDTYFDSIGSQKKQENGFLKSKTRVDLSNGDFIDPDAIFGYDDTEEVRLFVLEVANGHHTQRIVKQIKNVVFGVYSWAVAEKYNLKTTPCILIAFEHSTTQNAVMQQVKEDTYLINFNQLSSYLFFSTIENATKERTNSRQSIYGEIVDIWI